LTVLARTPDKVKIKHENLTVVQGDATNAEDIQKILKSNTDVLICSAGNGKDNVMMEVMAKNILTAAPKRAVVITSLGMNGSSPTIRFILSLIAGKKPVNDCDACDKLLCGTPNFVVVRPDGLCDQEPGNGKYNAALEGGMGMGNLPKADVALFLADLIEDSKFDGKGVNLYKNQ
jgi:hypothetical protein